MEKLFDIAGKVALVSGGSRGIGEMIAEGFVKNGVKTFITSRKAEQCDETAKRLSKFGECISIPADLTDSNEIKKVKSKVESETNTLNILVNNAGAVWAADFDNFPENGWDKVMDTNVKGVFFLTQKLLPLLEKNANSETPTHVINVGSIDGIKTPVFDNFSYGPSKAAVHHLTRVLAAHLIKRNIIVNGIAPGPFPTYMLSTGVGGGGDTENTDWDAVGKGNPRGRVGTAEDIAGLAIFLSSRACGFTVGDVITCDGGSVVS